MAKFVAFPVPVIIILGTLFRLTLQCGCAGEYYELISPVKSAVHCSIYCRNKESCFSFQILDSSAKGNTKQKCLLYTETQQATTDATPASLDSKKCYCLMSSKTVVQGSYRSSEFIRKDVNDQLQQDISNAAPTTPNYSNLPDEPTSLLTPPNVPNEQITTITTSSSSTSTAAATTESTTSRQTTPKKHSYDESYSICQEKDLQLVEIRNQTEEQEVRSMILGKDIDCFYLGIQKKDGLWKWDSDDTADSYKPWAKEIFTQILNYKKAYVSVKKNMQWEKADGSITRCQVMCQNAQRIKELVY